MGRLIDADKFKGKVIASHTGSGVIKLIAIDEVPTDYDPDMVTEQLKYNTTLFIDRNGDKVLLDDAIEIVKAGGDSDLLIDRAKSKSGERIPYDGKWK